MRRLISTCITCLALSLAAPAQAYTLDQAMAEIDVIFESGADPDEMALGIAGILRSVKASGVIDPDLAILYAMLADHLRLQARNPAYALQVAEDGLALIAGDPAQSDFQAALMASRAYALADLGRFAEAHAALTLALPTLAQTFGEDDIADYRKHAAEWAEGHLSDFNNSALDIARETLETAYAAQQNGAFGEVLVLAGSALLPMGTTFAEVDTRAVNTEAEKLTAEALFSLGRHREAANAYLRALGYMTASPWQLEGPPDWWGHVDTASAEIAFSVLNGLAAAATEINRPDVERVALAAAMEVAQGPRQRYTLLQRQARILTADGQIDAALDLLSQSRTIAQQAGLEVDALVAEFYVEMVRIYGQRIAQQPVDTTAFINVADRVLKAHETYQLPNRDFFLYSAAKVLRHGDEPEKTLEYARKALRWRQADLARKSDTAFGAAQSRRASRDTLEVFLDAAHTAGSKRPAPGIHAESCPKDDAYTSCLIVMDAD